MRYRPSVTRLSSWSLAVALCACATPQPNTETASDTPVASSGHEEPVIAPEASETLDQDGAQALAATYFQSLMAHDAESLSEVVGVPHTMDSPCDVAIDLEALLRQAAGFSETGEVEVTLLREVEGPDGLDGDLASYWAQLDPEPGSCGSAEDDDAIALAGSYPRRVFVVQLEGEAIPPGFQTLVRLSLIDGHWRVTGAGF